MPQKINAICYLFINIFLADRFSKRGFQFVRERERLLIGGWALAIFIQGGILCFLALFFQEKYENVELPISFSYQHENYDSSLSFPRLARNIKKKIIICVLNCLFAFFTLLMALKVCF